MLSKFRECGILETSVCFQTSDGEDTLGGRPRAPPRRKELSVCQLGSGRATVRINIVVVVKSAPSGNGQTAFESCVHPTCVDYTFHTPSLGDEEFEIPPITPPPESDPALGMPDVLLPFQGLSDPLPSQGSEFTPQFPPQSLDLPSITISRNLVEQDGVLHSSGLHMMRFRKDKIKTGFASPHRAGSRGMEPECVCKKDGGLDQMDQSHTQVPQYRQDHSLIMRSIVHMTDAARSGIMPHTQLTTINQSQLSAQLGLNLGGASLPHTSPSPPASKSATPSPSSSINEEDADESNRAIGEKRAAPDSGKKPKTPKKKKKKDPNEPQKPVSAYALFFRDTQAAIKGQNPNATFGEVSKIVASMWDSLGEEQKQVYKRKTEAAKKEYLKALAAYRASLVSKAAAESAEAQTIRSVQQTLASTNLTSSLLLNPPLSQHASVSVFSEDARGRQVHSDVGARRSAAEEGPPGGRGRSFGVETLTRLLRTTTPPHTHHAPPTSVTHTFSLPLPGNGHSSPEHIKHAQCYTKSLQKCVRGLHALAVIPAKSLSLQSDWRRMRSEGM
ncbi:hypothetical protein GH733_013126 [Mirounga leonina]|nr:hypothetical protein GH733_013126 [Mirounga leonina]